VRPIDEKNSTSSEVEWMSFTMTHHYPLFLHSSIRSLTMIFSSSLLLFVLVLGVASRVAVGD